MQTLEAKLAALPPHSIVFYMHVGRDGEHVNVNPLDYLDRIATLANAPTYCWVDSAMGRGIVGGSLRSLVGQSQAMAALSLRILRGERAGDIPLSSPDLNVREVDWRQLRRWSIDDARVPAGTVVRFHEPGFWQRNGFYIVGALVFLLAQSALIGGFVWLRARRRQAEERARGSEAALRASYDRIRDLGARLLNAQETERARIARELHDDISQQLALLEIDLELLGRATDGPAVAMAAVALTRAHAVGSSVHDLSHRLHPAKLRLIGLVAALQGLQHELSLPGLAVTFAHEHVPAALPADLTLCLFRVAQEGVQNAIKYSRARHISVRLAGEPDGLSLTIADDGVGFDVDAAWGKGLGLISMGERVEAIGGRLEIRSRPETGTRLDVRVPRPAMQDRQSIAV
jgi:signal transduction histidine kinase